MPIHLNDVYDSNIKHWHPDKFLVMFQILSLALVLQTISCFDHVSYVSVPGVRRLIHLHSLYIFLFFI